MRPIHFREFPIAALFLLSLAPRARAGGPLTLDAVFAEAAANNPDLAAARERVRVAELARKAAAAPFLPDVSAGASYTRSGGNVNGVGTISANDSYSVSATARENLFAGGRDAATYRRREAELAGAAADLDAIRATVSFNVKSAFARLLFSQQQVALAGSIKKRRDDNVRLVALGYDAGRENKGSYLRGKADASQAAFDVAQADRALRVARRQLLQSVGRGEFEAVTATGTLGAAAPEGLPEFSELVLHVPAVRSAAASLRVAETNIVSARSAFFPSLDASGSTGRAGDTWPPKDDRWSAGVSLSLPIFQGGRDAFGVKSARASLHASGDQKRSTEQQAATDLENTYATLADAAGRADVQAEYLNASMVRAEIARSQYTAGLVSFQDWNLIENDLITAQKSSLSSLRDAAIAEADWERTQGKGAVQ